MKRINVGLLLLAIILGFSACRSMRELKNLTKCQFRIETVKNIELAGVNIQNVRRFSDLGVQDAARATMAVMGSNLPLSMLVNMEVKNPNKQTAALNRIEWVAMIDDLEILNGIVNNRVEVLPNGIATIPLMVTTNLNEILKNIPKNDRLGFGLGIADQSGRPTRVSLKIKPSIMVGKNPVPYPGWLTIKRDFVSQ